MVNWHLLPSEKKIHETTMSRKVFLKFYMLAVALAALALLLSLLPLFAPLLGIGIPYLPVPLYVVGFVLLLSAAMPFAMGEMKKRREMIMITTDRVLVRKAYEKEGGINIETIPFDKLTNIRVRQTRSQRMLNIGDLVFVVSGEEHTLKDIDAPYAIEKAVYRIIEKDREIERKQA